MPVRSVARRTGTLLIALLTVAACTTSTSGTGTPHSSAAGPSSTSGSKATPTPTPSPSQVATVVFSDCSGLFNLSAAGIPASRMSKLTFGCGRLKVPLDYANPSGSTINIQLIKIHDKEQSNRVGSLLVNPGGPGGSGVFLAISLASSLDDDVLQHFDLVGFDPRGVGLSSPVSCYSDSMKDTDLALDPDVRTAAGLAQAKQASAAVADACTQKYGSALAQYTTVATAKDMDQIRQAVGDSKLNYLGYSYGTELGAVYAHLFPQNIRVAVLDGAVDPSNNAAPITSAGEQIKGFEDAFDQFAADCATRTACKPLGNARAAVAALEKTANATPLTAGGDSRKVTGGIVLLGTLSALYSKTQWPALGDALIAAQKGDGSGLLELADDYSERNSSGQYSNLLDVFTVVSCNDEAKTTDPTDAQIQATAVKWATQYPLFGLSQAAALTTCQAWQPTRTPLPPETAAGSVPIVVIGNLHDPATPYVGAVNLAKTLGTGVLLSWDGQGHTSYGQSTCVDDKVNTYLVDGTPPAAGITCPK